MTRKRQQYDFDWKENAEVDVELPPAQALDAELLSTLAAKDSAAFEPSLVQPYHDEPLTLRAIQALLAESPADPDLLLQAAMMALVEEQPELSLRYQHRFSKRYVAIEFEDQLLRAIAFAQQGRWAQAAQITRQYGIGALMFSVWCLGATPAQTPWLRRWLTKIEKEQAKRERELSADVAQAKIKSERPPAKQSRPSAPAPQADVKQENSPALPVFQFPIPISIKFPETLEAISPADSGHDWADFQLRYGFTHLGLQQVFDELLCLPHLREVDTYQYQVEAVRKVLKQFRGRVLLADEVGLGKTIEAGMVLKEYLLRGMAERVLILTPASLVKQWQEEMSLKFGISFAISHDSLLRQDPNAFWTQPRVIASIATARRPDHLALLASQPYDLVIVDEAHHVKNRAAANWKLVDALQKRFLLLLSATPVQNSLVEIYNLLTLLKPGIFKTEKEFRANYMTSGQPRKPANTELLRDLMRDVMIRNTRALVDVRLPPRHASTILLDPGEQEAALYQELSRLVQGAYRDGPTQRRLAFRHLLASAGSSPTTAAESLGRFVASNEVSEAWAKLRERYEVFSAGIKQSSLCQLLRRNAEEKKIVFVHHRGTLAALQRLLRNEALDFVVFEGSMSGPEKERAIEVFRDAVPLLLSTESGGEGRNLQFCNTIINFDLPWNPMAIEQRIGRVHRIGQTRDVFIFNLVVRHTLEEHILKILDEKINMFELVVGEIGAILGQMNEQVDFSEMVFAAWMETTAAEREKVFANLGDRLADAKNRYDLVKSLDAELFGDEFVAT